MTITKAAVAVARGAAEVVKDKRVASKAAPLLLLQLL
jgi:hypothetical protein